MFGSRTSMRALINTLIKGRSPATRAPETTSEEQALCNGTDFLTSTCHIPGDLFQSLLSEPLLTFMLACSLCACGISGASVDLISRRSRMSGPQVLSHSATQVLAGMSRPIVSERKSGVAVHLHRLTPPISLSCAGVGAFNYTLLLLLLLLLINTQTPRCADSATKGTSNASSDCSSRPTTVEFLTSAIL